MHRLILLLALICMSVPTSGSQTKPSGPMTNDTAPTWGTEDLLSETFDSLRDLDRLAVDGVEAKDMPAVLARLRQMPNLTTLEFVACDLSGVDENSPVPANVKNLGITDQGKVSQGTIRWLATFPKGTQLVFNTGVPNLSFDDLGSFTWITFDNCEISQTALKLVGDPKIGKVTFIEVTLTEARPERGAGT